MSDDEMKDLSRLEGDIARMHGAAFAHVDDPILWVPPTFEEFKRNSLQVLEETRTLLTSHAQRQT